MNGKIISKVPKLLNNNYVNKDRGECRIAIYCLNPVLLRVNTMCQVMSFGLYSACKTGIKLKKKKFDTSRFVISLK